MYQITLNIDGMMCAMCESHVNDAVRNAFPVKKVTSSHSRGETVILSETAIPEAELRPVFSKLGYALMGYACAPYAAGGGQMTAACRLCYFGSKPRSMQYTRRMAACVFASGMRPASTSRASSSSGTA